MKPITPLFFLLIFIVCGNSLSAQGEANIWYFGDSAGIDFNVNPPVALTNSAVDITITSQTAISDPCGNLLFYTNSRRIWDKTHQQMPNGFGLSGSSGFPHNLIAPQPGSNDIFYIFYIGGLSFKNSILYSKVDMSLQGGLGDVVQKNVLLLDSTSNKIAGVQHSNQTDIWLVTLDGMSDEFHSYLITSTGLSTSPVISNVGPVMSATSFNVGEDQGQFKISPDGKKIALAALNLDFSMVFDFDPTTGIVSNPLTLPSLNANSGIEFSPDGTKLYQTAAPVSSTPNDVYQYDLSAGSTAAIISSGIIIGSSTFGTYGIELAPDGKIYVVRPGVPGPPHYSEFMDVINNPNEPGLACNFVSQGFDISPRCNRFYPPTFLAHYLLPDEIIFQQDSSSASSCTGDSIFFSLSKPGSLDSALWNFGDLGSGALNTANDPAPFHVYTSPGSYPIEVLVYRGCPEADTLRDTLEILPTPMVDLGPDTSICQGNLLSLLAGNQAVDYLWQDSSTANTFDVTLAGLYWVEASNACDTVRDSIFVNVDMPGMVDLGPDTLICAGASVLLDATISGGNYLWQDSSMSSTFLAGTTDLFWVQAENACGQYTDSIAVAIENLPVFDLGADTVICAGQTLLLSAGFPNRGSASWLWQDGSVDSVFSVSSSGTYWVEGATICGSLRDSILVEVVPLPAVDLGADTILCENEILLLDVAFPLGNYQWQDGSSDSIFQVVNSGLYWVELTTLCGRDRDSINISFDSAPVLDLGADTILCEGENLMLDATTLGATYLWQNGSTQPIFSVDDAGLYHLTLTRGACMVSDSISIEVQSTPDISLGADTLLCDGNSLTLDATYAGATYLWQDGSTQPTLSLNQPGTYWVALSHLCGNISDTISVEAGISPSINLGADTILCEGESLLLDASFPQATYLWQDGSTDPSYEVTLSGIYSVSIQTLCGNDSDERAIEYESLPIIDLGPDTLICEGESLELIPTSDADAYRWQDGSTQPTFFAQEAGTYIVAGINGCGTASDTLYLSTQDCNCYLYLPTAFTPNQDGINEAFGPAFQCEFLSFEFHIFNRWGKRVFQTDSPTTSWDGYSNGSPASEGVYTWMIRYTYQGRGRAISVRRAGTVTLLR